MSSERSMIYMPIDNEAAAQKLSEISLHVVLAAILAAEYNTACQF